MAFGHGKDAAVKLDNAAGTLTDITAYVTRVTLSRNGETADITTLADDWTNLVGGMKNATISIEGPYDPTFATIGNAALGAQKTFEYGPQGTGTGAPKATVEAFGTSFAPTSGTDDASRWTLELATSGSITDSTYA